jgi:hypothetical protein
MMNGDGCRNIGRCSADKISSVSCCNVLKHHPQPWKALQQGHHIALDEYLFTIEDIYISISDFSMNQQRQAAFFHRFQCSHAMPQVRNARVGICRCSCRIQFYSMHNSTGFGLFDLICGCAIRQV